MRQTSNLCDSWWGLVKQFTDAGIMLLAEDGKLKSDDPLGKYVPDVPAKWSGITIRQLLNQVSGIPNYTAGGKLVPEKIYTKAEILGFVKVVPTGLVPGTRWEYSHPNYFLLRRPDFCGSYVTGGGCHSDGAELQGFELVRGGASFGLAAQAAFICRELFNPSVNMLSPFVKSDNIR